jgi:hypothetical protein
MGRNLNFLHDLDDLENEDLESAEITRYYDDTSRRIRVREEMTLDRIYEERSEEKREKKKGKKRHSGHEEFVA